MDSELKSLAENDTEVDESFLDPFFDLFEAGLIAKLVVKVFGTG